MLARDQRLGRQGPARSRRYKELKADGSTSCGCWIYCGVFADGVNQAARRKPHWEQELHRARVGAGRGRRTGGCSTTAPRPTPTATRGRSARSSSGGTSEQQKWTGTDTPDFDEEKPPDYVPPDGAKGPDAIAGDHPFIMQADGLGWLYVPQGLDDGPLPTHYEPHESPFDNPLYAQRANPRAPAASELPEDPYNPSREPGSTVPVRRHDLPADRAPHRRRDVALRRRTSRSCSRRCSSRCTPSSRASAASSTAAGRRSSPTRSAIEARVMVTDRMRPVRDRRRGAPPGRAAVPLGPARAHDRRRRERPRAHGARPERPHPGGQGVHVRHPRRAAARAARSSPEFIARPCAAARVSRRAREPARARRTRRGR